MDLRGGSLLRADGGFLVMYALDTLTETGVWRTLKRTLNHGKLEIQPVDMFFPVQRRGAQARADRRPRENHPDRRPRHVRAALRLRGRFQEDFQGARRIRRRDELERRGFPPVRRTPAQACRRRKASPLRPLGCRRRSSSTACASPDGRGKITTRFFDLADLARESSYAARHNGNKIVTAGTCARLSTRRSSATTCSKRKSAR